MSERFLTIYMLALGGRGGDHRSLAGHGQFAFGITGTLGFEVFGRDVPLEGAILGM